MGRNWYISYASLGLGYQSSGDALVSFGKDAFEMNLHHTILGNKTISPQKNWQQKRKMEPFKSEMMLFCFVVPEVGGFHPVL